MLPHVKVKSRSLMIVLYPESQQEAIDNICKNFSHVGMLHDKDVDDDGNLKKAHWHFVLRFNQARWSSGVAKELGIEDHFESTKSIPLACRYLCHLDDPDKYQYDPADASCSEDLSPIFFKAVLGHVSEESCVKAILDLIDSYQYPISYHFLLHKVLEFGLWADFRRSPSIFALYIQEHNQYLGDLTSVPSR